MTSHRDPADRAGNGSLAAAAIAVIMALSLTGCAGGSEPEGTAARSSAAASSPTPVEPFAPPLPRPRTAKVGQPIRVAEFDHKKLRAGHPEPWATADIVVTSVRTMRTDPALPKAFRTSKTGHWVLIKVRTDIKQGPFTLSNLHFQLMTPDGKVIRDNDNAVYHADWFQDVADSKPTGTKGAAAPGSGLLLYEVPGAGLPRGSRLQVELIQDQEFGWVLS